MRKRLSAILSGAAVPAWLLFFWTLADIASRVDTIGRAMRWLSILVSTQPGVMLVTSVIWLTFVMVWPDLKERMGLAKAISLSETDQRLLERAKEELRSLTPAQKIALAMIYENPGHFVGVLNKQLLAAGLDIKEITSVLMSTCLISLDGRMNMNPSQHAVVARAVETFLAQTTLRTLSS